MVPLIPKAIRPRIPKTCLLANAEASRDFKNRGKPPAPFDGEILLN